MAVRQAALADAPAVAGVLIRSRRAAAGAIPPSAHTDEETRAWVATVVLPGGEVWLAEARGEVIAVLVLDGDWIDQLYVLPEWTGSGVGSRLVDLAKELRPGGLQLWTFVMNVGAQRFYLRHGFVVAETTDGSANEERAPDMRLVWPGPSAAPARAT